MNFTVALETLQVFLKRSTLKRNADNGAMAGAVKASNFIKVSEFDEERFKSVYSLFGTDYNGDKEGGAIWSKLQAFLVKERPPPTDMSYADWIDSFGKEWLHNAVFRIVLTHDVFGPLVRFLCNNRRPTREHLGKRHRCVSFITRHIHMSPNARRFERAKRPAKRQRTRECSRVRTKRVKAITTSIVLHPTVRTVQPPMSPPHTPFIRDQGIVSDIKALPHDGTARAIINASKVVCTRVRAILSMRYSIPRDNIRHYKKIWLAKYHPDRHRGLLDHDTYRIINEAI